MALTSNTLPQNLLGRILSAPGMSCALHILDSMQDGQLRPFTCCRDDESPNCHCPLLAVHCLLVHLHCSIHLASIRQVIPFQEISKGGSFCIAYMPSRIIRYLLSEVQSQSELVDHSNHHPGRPFHMNHPPHWHPAQIILVDKSNSLHIRLEHSVKWNLP